MIIERTTLPGIGTCHAATTAHRQRIGVISHHSGRRDLIFYDPDDQQRAANAVVLDPAEAQYLADLLARTTTIEHVRGRDHPAAPVALDRIRIPAHSPHHGRPLRDLHDPGVVVAVIRDQQVLAAPGPEFVLLHGDTLVTAGEPARTEALAEQIGHDPAYRSPPPAPPKATHRPHRRRRSLTRPGR